MRKKMKMRAGGKVAKYADGGSVDGSMDAFLSASGVPGYEPRRRAAAPTPPRRSLIDNSAVGARARVPLRAEVRAMEDVDATGPGASARPVRMDMPVPPVPPARRPLPAQARAVGRRRQMSADELNDREMTRILNERSLEAAQAGRNMYKKGGKVAAKARKR